MTFQIEPYSEKCFSLGEGPHWQPTLNRLLFVDLVEGVAATLDHNKQLTVLVKQTDTLSAVLPVAQHSHRVVVSVGTSLYSVDTTTGHQTLIDALNKPGVRFNDAKCDPCGRLWIGTMGLESAPGILDPERGSLYLLSPEGKLVEKVDKVTLSNGLSWSSDGSAMYFIDSVKRHIYRFDFDLTTGDIANRRVLVNMDENDGFTSAELPDGMTIDVNNNLWVAMFNGSRIVNIDGQTGKILQYIEMPTSMITSVCFGGQNLTEMYVTSAKKFLSEEKKAKEPLAGHIFKITSTNSDFKGFQPNFDLKL